MIEQAGADALELNLYEVATQLDASSVAIEERIVNVVRDLKGLIKDPHRRETLALLHGTRQPGSRNSTPPARTGWCSSTGSTSLTSISAR